MPSSRRELQLQGPRPPPLKVSKDSWRPKKAAAATAPSRGEQHDRREPVVVYLHTPKVIHAKPQDFMSLVQRLTGKSSASSPSRSSTSSDLYLGHAEVDGGLRRAAGMDDSSVRDLGARQNVVIGAGAGGEDGDPPLLLTLGQFSSVPSPIISPSLFFCSPSAQPSLQDFSSLF